MRETTIWTFTQEQNFDGHITNRMKQMPLAVRAG